ncbi:helix-turn-helix domain-containing protein [Salinispirillum sp. LH 10-3-1]|uniref:Helix-turn-helix domain-containing protein n=1 Tax=Salinispirillum sp. LH 10-3-1 TaxID=2952525 RepID=A0AB38YCC1_9GAMM
MAIEVQYIKITDFMNTYFKPGQAPARNTVINMIERKEIPGKRFGKVYYINRHEWEKRLDAETENDIDPLVKMVMNG